MNPTETVQTSDVRTMLAELREQRKMRLRADLDPAVEIIAHHRPVAAVASVTVEMLAVRPTTAARCVAIALEHADELGDFGYVVTNEGERVDPRDPEPLTGSVIVRIHRD